MSTITRRQFLEDSILAAAAAATASIPAPLIAAEARATSANDKITVAIIGCGIRGKQHAGDARTDEDKGGSRFTAHNYNEQEGFPVILLLVNKPGKLSCFQYHINVRSALVGVKQRHQPVEPVAADSGRT